MQNIFIELLPPWVETGLQPAFYDKESGTVLQQTARMYARVNLLTQAFNTFSEDTTTYVNQFVDDTNAEIERFEHDTNETVDDYIEKFNDLHDYVYDYFDNLDVQEEINNKLDDMLEAGTLQEIITTYVQSNVAWTFDSVAEMKTATNLVAGSYAQTYGYYNANDGGKALYKIRAISNDDTADDKFIIAIGSTLVAELITDDLVNICQVGGQQNTASVCNYIIGSMGKSVYIPAQSFNLTETIHINNNYTKLICDGDLTVTTENIAGICLRANRCIVKLNGELTATDGIGLEICGGDHHAFDDDIFFNSITAKIGVLVDPDNGKGFQTSKISFNRINGTEIGISLAPQNTGNPWVTTLTVYAGHITSPYPVRFRKGANQTDRFNQIVFYDTTFSGHVQTAIDIERCQNVWFYRCRMVEGMEGSTWVKLDDCGFVHIDNEGFLPVDKISITNPMSYTFPNFFSGQMLTNSSQNAIATKAKTHGTDICMLEEPLLKQDIVITGFNNADFDVPEFYHNGMIVQIGGDAENTALDYTLPTVFDTWGVTEFYIYVSNKPATSSLRLRDNPHNTLLNIASGSALSNKRWHVQFVKYISGHPQWIVTALN